MNRKQPIGFRAIAETLELAAVKAAVAIAGIIARGRLKQFTDNVLNLPRLFIPVLDSENEQRFRNTAGGMSIDPKFLVSNFPVIAGTLALLLGGKTVLVAVVGKLFGISIISAIRVGLLLAPGGEFEFVASGEAVNQGIMSSQLSSLLLLVVGISMALTPWLAAGGQLIASRFEQHDIIAQLLSERLIPFVALDVRRSLCFPIEFLQDTCLTCVCDYELERLMYIWESWFLVENLASLSANSFPKKKNEKNSSAISVTGYQWGMPWTLLFEISLLVDHYFGDKQNYFGDAGSREVLHKVGAERACAAAITLDTPGANYRTVWALSKYFINVKTFVRAHDVDHGLNLEKAGATAVVPETLEPSLQLAAAVLAQAKLPTSEIAATINEFRSRHLAELTDILPLTLRPPSMPSYSGSSLGYGFSRVTNKSKTQLPDSSDENISEGTLAI
ncbi:K(+) efflux antiporter 2 [Hibiscus syriacus]|uniref:K(+) efflux antiporter 2 n=1 Tax=Hibiscus syriacus TaxID=106335 RepID=A0A6A3AL70_HIBSY|nr:K(+) efflux antiporter 2 [Hibiscus syriacus]